MVIVLVFFFSGILNIHAGLTPAETEAALELASQQALNQDTRTEAHINADNQAALNNAVAEDNRAS